MFWFTHSKRIEALERRSEVLEQQNKILSLALQNIQSALTASALSQEGVAKDVREIQELISNFLHQAESAAILYGFDPDDGYEH